VTRGMYNGSSSRRKRLRDCLLDGEGRVEEVV